MAAYQAGQATQLSRGQIAQVVSGAQTAKSSAVLLDRNPDAEKLTVFNNTDQNATLQLSLTDTDAGFLTTTMTVNSGDAAVFPSVSGPYARLLFAASVTTGTASFYR